MNLRTLILIVLGPAFFVACTKKSTSSSPSPVGTRHFQSMKVHSLFESNHSTTPATVIADTKDTVMVPDFVITITALGSDEILLDGQKTYSRWGASTTMVSYRADMSHSHYSQLDYYPVQDSIHIQETIDYFYYQGDTIFHEDKLITYTNSL